MKIIDVILIIFVSIIVIGTVANIEFGSEPKIDEDLKPYLQEFKDYCRLAKIDLNKVNKLDTLVFKNDLEWLGLHTYNSYREKIEIKEDLRKHPTALKCVVFHELFHVVGIDHDYKSCKESIMSEELSIKEMEEVFSDEEFFSAEVFRNLNKIK